MLPLGDTTMNKAELTTLVVAAIEAGATVTEVAPVAEPTKRRGRKADVVPAHIQAMADAAVIAAGETPEVADAPKASVSTSTYSQLNLSTARLHFTPKVANVRAQNTRQGYQAGQKLGLGRSWYQQGPVALSLRHQVIELLAEELPDGGEFSADDFKCVLAKRKDLLGSGTPASFLRAFIKEGYVEAA